MDRCIIDNDSPNNLTINKDSYIIISSEVQSKNIEFNILDCKVTIIDMASCSNKNLNLKNCEANFIEIVNNKKNRKVLLNNDKSIVEYNIIDLFDQDIDYYLEGNCVGEGSNSIVNIASICYKNKIKIM